SKKVKRLKKVRALDRLLLKASLIIHSRYVLLRVKDSRSQFAFVQSQILLGDGREVCKLSGRGLAGLVAQTPV
ncbi:hypothetical protein, partial [Microcoleus sp. F4-D5]|uniref:hypothetical protein n=1 Tax=Microcoleus sp. F4-D5 TaxID=2818760 RepID=UPI002FD5E168